MQLGRFLDEGGDDPVGAGHLLWTGREIYRTGRGAGIVRGDGRFLGEFGQHRTRLGPDKGQGGGQHFALEGGIAVNPQGASRFEWHPKAPAGDE